MSELHTNSSYKIKAGSVPNDDGLIPEAGALIFDLSIPALVVGDGFNFLTLGGGATQNDATATQLVTPGADLLAAGVPDTPITIYDTVVYTLGTTVTPTLGTTYTLTADGVIDISNDFALNSTAPNTELLIEVLINGLPVASRIVNMISASKIYQNAWVNNLAVLNGDVITYRFTADKGCTIAKNVVNIGIHYR